MAGTETLRQVPVEAPALLPQSPVLPRALLPRLPMLPLALLNGGRMCSRRPCILSTCKSSSQ